jgi:hypothetical protein
MSAEVMSPHTSPSPLPPSQHHQQQQQPNNAQLYQHKPILLNMEDPAAITTTAAAAAAAAVAGSDGSGQVAEEAEVDVTAETEVEDDLHMQDCTYGVQLYAPTAPLDASLTALEDEVGRPSLLASLNCRLVCHIGALTLPSVIIVLANGGTIGSPVHTRCDTEIACVVSTTVPPSQHLRIGLLFPPWRKWCYTSATFCTSMPLNVPGKYLARRISS